MSQSYKFQKRIEQLHVDDIQHDEQGNIIYDELEQKERNSERWQDLEKKYGINFGDVVKIDDHLGRVQELHVLEESKDSNGLTKIEHFGEYVSEESKDSNGLTGDRVSMRLWGGTELEDFECSEIGMTAKEFLKDIKIQPKERTLSIKEKIKNTIKTNVQTLKKTLKKGGAAERLANRRAKENQQEKTR